MTKSDVRKFMEQAEPKLVSILTSGSKPYNNLVPVHKRSPLEENAMDADAEMAKQFPYSEMAKFGWVPETREAKENLPVHLKPFLI